MRRRQEDAIGLLPEIVDSVTPFSYVVGAARTQVLAEKTTRPAKASQPKTGVLAATGVDDALPWAGALLIAASGAVWRVRRRR